MPRHSHAEAAARLGLAYAKKGDKRLRKAFASIPRVTPGASIQHEMRGRLHTPTGERDVLVFQSFYLVPAGQVMVPVMTSVCACAAPAWPKVIVRRRQFAWVSRVLGRRPGLTLDDRRFNRVLRVDTADEDFALVLLTPQMQALMLEEPKASWRIERGSLDAQQTQVGTAGGRVCLVLGSTLKPDRVAELTGLMARFWELVPEELLAW